MHLFAFALNFQAETLEDLYEWKIALEQALAQAPSAALVMGHNGIFRNDANDTIDGSFHQCTHSCFNNVFPFLFKLFYRYTFWSHICVDMNVLFFFFPFLPKFIGFLNNLGREKRPVKSMVVGRPILLALEDIDGGPSFLEKALRFLEKYGKVLILYRLYLQELLKFMFVDV